MANWFKLYETDLDETRMKFALSKLPEVWPVWTAILIECCRHRGDCFPWGADEQELFGFSDRLKISIPKINHAVSLLCEIRYISLKDGIIKVLKWNEKQDDYLARKSRGQWSKRPKQDFAANHGESPRVTDIHGESPRVTDIHGESPRVTDIHGESPRVTDIHGESPRVTDIHGESPRITVTHGDSHIEERRGEENRGEREEKTSAHAQSSDGSFAEIPSWEEFWTYCKGPQCSLAAEWYAKDKWEKANQTNWRQIPNWRAYARRCKTWWESDGRPMTPPVKANGKSFGKATEQTVEQRAEAWLKKVI